MAFFKAPRTTFGWLCGGHVFEDAFLFKTMIKARIHIAPLDPVTPNPTKEQMGGLRHRIPPLYPSTGAEG